MDARAITRSRHGRHRMWPQGAPVEEGRFSSISSKHIGHSCPLDLASEVGVGVDGRELTVSGVNDDCDDAERTVNGNKRIGDGDRGSGMD